MSAPRVIEITLPPSGVLGATGQGVIEVMDDRVEIRSSNTSVTLNLSAINGVRYHSGTCELFTRHGMFALRGTDTLASVELDLVSRAGALPGVTRALRALGSHRGRPGAEHDRFFAPLLAARRRAERAVDGAVRLAAFDGAALKRGIESAVLELARQRYPAHPSSRRAEEEELLELAEPLLDACEGLAARAAAVREAEPDVTMVRWREWTEAVQRTFEVADRAWIRVATALTMPVRPRRSLWKRLFTR